MQELAGLSTLPVRNKRKLEPLQDHSKQAHKLKQLNRNSKKNRQRCFSGGRIEEIKSELPQQPVSDEKDDNIGEMLQKHGGNYVPDFGLNNSFNFSEKSERNKSGWNSLYNQIKNEDNEVFGNAVKYMQAQKWMIREFELLPVFQKKMLQKHKTLLEDFFRSKVKSHVEKGKGRREVRGSFI